MNKSSEIFRQLTNIDTAFKHIRTFSIILISLSISVCCFSIYKSYEFVTYMQNHIYVIANGKAIDAFSTEQNSNIPVEARDHVKMFHYYFFTLDPDEKVIQSNLTKALYLADESAQRQYDNLKDNSYYANIISGNITQKVIIDSTRIDIGQYPYYFRCHARQVIMRATSTVTRSLITEGYLRHLNNRSDSNPHGLLIEKWNTLENKDIKTDMRQ